MKKISHALRNIKRHYIYISLAVIVLFSLLVKVPLPVEPGRFSTMFFNEIDSLNPGDTVLLSIEYDYASQPELEPMAVSFLRHAFRKHLRVVIVSMWPQGPEMGERALARALRMPELRRRKLVYGEDYINLGYRPGGVVVVRSMNSDIVSTFETDFFGQPLENVPILRKARSLRQMSAVVDLFAGGVNGINGPILYAAHIDRTLKDVRILSGSSAVLAAEQYSFLHSGQIHGLLAGIRGAADYEFLLGADSDEGGALSFMPAQSMAHLFIIILVLLGNIGFWFRGRRR